MTSILQVLFVDATHDQVNHCGVKCAGLCDITQWPDHAWLTAYDWLVSVPLIPPVDRIGEAWRNDWGVSVVCTCSQLILSQKLWCLHCVVFVRHWFILCLHISCGSELNVGDNQRSRNTVNYFSYQEYLISRCVERGRNACDVTVWEVSVASRPGFGWSCLVHITKHYVMQASDLGFHFSGAGISLSADLHLTQIWLEEGQIQFYPGFRLT